MGGNSRDESTDINLRRRRARVATRKADEQRQEHALGVDKNTAFDGGDQARNDSQGRSLAEILSSRSCPKDPETRFEDYGTQST